MKALTYVQAHPLEKFALELTEQNIQGPTGYDVQIDVQAFSINPVDYKVRASRSGTVEAPVILGWDGAGTIAKVGADVTQFKVGDEVYFAGDLNRNGTYAEKVLIDSRIISLKPKSLSFAEAAALPLTSLTVWEALLEKNLSIGNGSKVLIIGGAGGVGSSAIQILKAKTNATVIATASREETVSWAKSLGADYVINHRNNLQDELNKIGIHEVDVIFSTTHTDQYLSIVPNLLRPFGHFILVDDPKTLDIVPFKRKALSIHWELMFTKTLFKHNLSSQGRILSEVAKLVDEKKLRSTLQVLKKGLSVENARFAHDLVEKGQSIGKVVVEI